MDGYKSISQRRYVEKVCQVFLFSFAIEYENNLEFGLTTS